MQVQGGIYVHLKILFLFNFREGKVGRKRGKHQCVVASCAPPTGDLARNPGMSPDCELNQRPFGLQARAQSRAAPARALPSFKILIVSSIIYIYYNILYKSLYIILSKLLYNIYIYTHTLSVYTYVYI